MGWILEAAIRHSTCQARRTFGAASPSSRVVSRRTRIGNDDRLEPADQAERWVVILILPRGSEATFVCDDDSAGRASCQPTEWFDSLGRAVMRDHSKWALHLLGVP